MPPSQILVLRQLNTNYQARSYIPPSFPSPNRHETFSLTLYQLLQLKTKTLLTSLNDNDEDDDALID